MKTQWRHLFSWWILDTSAVLLIGLLWLVHWLVASPMWRQALDIVLLLGIYGLIDWWIRRHYRDLDDPQVRDHTPSQYSLEMED
jgi:hypothetical protein